MTQAEMFPAYVRPPTPPRSRLEQVLAALEPLNGRTIGINMMEDFTDIEERYHALEKRLVRFTIVPSCFVKDGGWYVHVHVWDGPPTREDCVVFTTVGPTTWIHGETGERWQRTNNSTPWVQLPPFVWDDVPVTKKEDWE